MITHYVIDADGNIIQTCYSHREGEGAVMRFSSPDKPLKVVTTAEYTALVGNTRLALGVV